MQEFSTEVLHRPATYAQRYLPEGPYPISGDRISWVSIQHGPDESVGSLNIFDLSSGGNQNIPLNGRPGFAFSTDTDCAFVIGLEREVGLFNVETLEWTVLCSEVDADVEGTIINDGVAFAGGLVFGCKDLKFEDNKAGLYLWRRSDGELIRLRNDQTCSNGKIIFGDGDIVTLIDIDTPTKTVVRYDLNVAEGSLSEPQVVVDLRSGDDFPDGMIATPDGRSVIIAFYNPADTEFGAARQYSIESGELEAVWKTEKSPRVTCPQLIRFGDRVRLVLTTADEGMTAEQQALHSNAGCLFVADTDFDSVPHTPAFTVT